MAILFELLNYLIGTICFAGAILAFVVAGWCFWRRGENNTISGIINGILGVVLFSLGCTAFFTI